MIKRARIGLAVAALVGICIPLYALMVGSHWRMVRELRAWSRGAILLPDGGVRLQEERTDCGQTALRNALALLHQSIRRPSLLLPRPVGLSPKEIVEISLSEGIAARQIRGRTEILEEVRLPVVALIGTHYVTVARRLRNHRFVVLDPAVGSLLVDLDFLRKGWRGVVVAFDSSGSLPPRPLGSKEVS